MMFSRETAAGKFPPLFFIMPRVPALQIGLGFPVNLLKTRTL